MPYDEKCDIYSAGMVFGSLLVSLPEVCVEEYHATLFRNTVAQYIPSHTSHLLVQLLEPDPKKRLAAKDILQLPYFTAIMS
jgi:serine/threonine protein kinase